jgi:uncharacterized protein YhjY with autotransporter beta-barrel domain
LAGLLHTGSATAQCLPDPAAEGDTVSCSGVITNAYVVPTGIDDVTVIVENGASIETFSDSITVNDESTVTNNGTITVNGTGSTAVRAGNGASAFDRARIINSATGDIHLQGTSTIGIRVGLNAEVENFGAIHGQAANQLGINVDGGSRATNLGRIELSGADATALRGGAGATVGNEVSGVIELAGPSSRGLEVGAAGTIEQRGTLWMGGDGSIGLLGADGTGSASITRSTVYEGATITLDGDDSIGISSGSFAVGENQGTITLRGVNDTAIQVGADSNAGNFGVIRLQGTGGVGISSGDQSRAFNAGVIDITGDGGTAIQTGANGEARNAGTIRVSGVDSVGVRVGGYAAGSQPDSFLGFQNFIDSGTLSVGRVYSVDPNAGALIVLEESTDGESRMRNFEGASIQADLTNIAQAGRGVAVDGSAGVDVVVNDGLIEGRITLQGGDDIYRQSTSGQFVYSVDGALDGGGHTGAEGDVIELIDGSASRGQLLLDSVQNFETLRIESGSWQLQGASPTPMNVDVGSGSTLLLSEPFTVGGSYDHTAPQVAGDPVAVVHALLGRSALSAPLMHVDGDASLDDGQLRVDVGGGLIGRHSFTIVETDGSITEPFDEIVFSSSPGLIFGTPQYLNGNQLLIDVQIVGYTENQTITNAYLGRVESGTPSAGLQAILDDLNALTYAQYRQAMDLLHPEAYDAHASATLDLGNRFTELMMQRPRYCVPNAAGDNLDPRTKLPCRTRRLEPWFTAYGLFRSRDGEPGHTSYEDSAGGLVFGVDRRVSPHFLLTGTIGTSYDVLRVDQVGKGRIATLDVGLYGGYTNGPLRVQGAFSYGHGWNTQFRNIRFTGFARTASSDFDIDRVGTRVRGEYGFDVFSIGLTPMASIDYTALIRSEVNETGAESVSLIVDGQTDNVVTVRAGVEVGAAYKKDQYWNDTLEYADGTWRPNLSVAWRQVVSGADRDLTARFIGASPADAGLFTVRADDASQGFEIGAGVDFTPRMANRLTVGARYDAFVWTGITSHEVMLRLRYSF